MYINCDLIVKPLYNLQMAEVGLTEAYGDTGYKFEIWFRKRSKGESYILQAQSSDIRHHWVKEISRVLWNQAIKNRGGFLPLSW